MESKNYLILGFWKKYKDPNDGKNFTPLVLSSCVLKMLGMIKSKLEWKIEKEELLSRYQIDFRVGKGIWDNIIQDISKQMGKI